VIFRTKKRRKGLNGKEEIAERKEKKRNIRKQKKRTVMERKSSLFFMSRV
jgi:hypothetical protein